MVETDYQLISVGFIAYMCLHWLAEVVFSFYTEFAK